MLQDRIRSAVLLLQLHKPRCKLWAENENMEQFTNHPVTF